MAAFKVLYVTGGPVALTKVRELRVNQQRGSFVGTGDNTIAVSAGRAAVASGTAICENAETAESILSAIAADAVFTCQGDTGAVTVTVTKFLAHGSAVSIGDGTKQNDNVAGFEISFIAENIVIAAGA